MLRLKPSELTLTPEDVDETLRRMARRQPPQPPPASRPPRPRTSGRPLAPRLMPGPQRSVRAAITDLGNIPILRPPPQQATIAHVDDEYEDSDEALDGPAPPLVSLLSLAPVPTQTVRIGAALAIANIPALRHSSQLPFRLTPPHRRLETSQDASSSPNEQAGDSEGDFVEPAGPPAEPTNVPTPDTPGRRGANEDIAEGPLPARQPNQSTTPAGLRGGASHPQRNRVRSVGQDVLHAPSPLRQSQVHSQSEEYSSDSDEEHPVIHLQGYFNYKSNPNAQYAYTFREVFPDAPRTEPFRRISQPRFHTRSQSSNDTPAPHLVTPTPIAQNDSGGDDVFWTAPAPTPGRSNNGRTSGRSRLQSSEMSNTSLAYSYYELPENRQSSGENAAQDLLTQSQYDGTAALRQASLGTYRSVRLSDAQALNDNVPRPPTPNTSSFAPPIPAFVGQWGASPLPAEPYARTGSIGHRHQLAIRRATQADPGHASHSDAVAAAVENRISPLDALTAQYGWASHHLVGQPGEPQRVHQVGRHGSTYYSPFSGPSPYGPPMAMADDPYTLGATAHAGQHALPYTALPISAQPAPMLDYPGPPNYHGPPGYHVPSLPRTTQAIRSGQRSSENAPVGPSTQDGRVARNAQVREQVSAFEQMQIAAQPRQTRRPQVAPRHHNEPASSPILPALPMIPPRHGLRHHAALSPGHGNVGRRSVRMDPRLQDQENSGEAETEMMRQEFEAVRARYDAEQQGDVMDETPPRIGRVERLM
ncbi:uncharacterized protein EKO05_0005712 [Ascochyta rabiei]|uniref:Uncharacterized protein n=1 Tax=Didymella rabiei TaxID=5454 RepID=A0A163EJU5_DIDRA|nr:uncharacterized protein EKO05_0005712 [Ascochyta rabiei]KZM23727.1 hypothetical protein ST47_g5145 [Ascochyta rabiei]UPX15257.1 hypothetical protein EKO05_0005712 [Ascochyta rabiei]